METIFDYDLTPDEIEVLGADDALSMELRHGLDFPDPLTEQGYRDTITQEAAVFDLWLLFTQRDDQKKADTYYQQVSEKVDEYNRGFDYVVSEA